MKNETAARAVKGPHETAATRNDQNQHHTRPNDRGGGGRNHRGSGTVKATTQKGQTETRSRPRAGRTR